jgi:hypothetical protein
MVDTDFLWIDDVDLDLITELRSKRGNPLNRNSLSKYDLDDYFLKS